MPARNLTLSARRDAAPKSPAGVRFVNLTPEADPRTVATANALAAGAAPLPEEEQRKFHAAVRDHFDALDDACDEVITRSPEAMPIAFADGAKPSVGHSTWNQIARVAEFNGHAQGPVKFTPEVFAEILRNFAANGNGEIPLDYEHTSERLPENAALVGVPAPGWVTKVEVRNGGRELWALFKWASADAVRYVRDGQYKYVSPAINFKSRDKVTGKPAGARLTSVALTNHPFIEGMQPLAADDRSRALDALLTPLARALNVTVADLAAAVGALKPAEQAALAAPPADSLHAPTNAAGAPATEPKMDPEKTDDEMAEADAAMADLPKMQPDAPPAAAAGDPAKDKAEKDAADAAQPDGRRDPAGRFASMMGRLGAMFGMEGAALDAEGAEDALIEKVRGALDALAQHQEREKAALAQQAAAMSDRVVAAGLAPESARERLAALCLSNRATFDALYPAAEVEKAEGARALSDRGGPTRDGAAILTQRVGLSGGRAPTTPDGSQTFNDRVEAETERVMRDEKVDRFTARRRAETIVRASH
jgi:hypothetical protein